MLFCEDNSLLTIPYNNTRPVARVRIVAVDINGNQMKTPILEIMVDTGASHVTLPDHFVKEHLNTYLPGVAMASQAVETGKEIDVAWFNEATIQFLSENDDVIHAEIIEEPFIVLSHSKYILGRNIINKHIYEFKRGQELKINF